MFQSLLRLLANEEEESADAEQLDESEYKKLGEELLTAAWRTLNSPDWKLEKKLDNGDMVQVKQVNGKRVFKLTGYVEMAPRLLLEELFYRIESVPSWNPTLVECKTIQPIDEHTDISYQVCAEAGGGVVSTRDFVNLRHWALVDGVYISAGGSVNHPAMPPQVALLYFFVVNVTHLSVPGTSQ